MPRRSSNHIARHMMSALSSMVAWAGADWDAAASTRAPDDRRSDRWARGGDGRLHARLRGAGSRRSVRRRAAAGHRARGGRGERLARDDPAAALGPGRDRRAARRSGPRHRLRPGRLRARPCRPRAGPAGAVRGDRRSGATRPRAGRQTRRPGSPTASAYLADLPEVAQPALHHGRGLVALAAGSTGIARQELDAAVRGWDACGRVWEATWARLDLASCLTRMNRFAEAVDAAATPGRSRRSSESDPLAERADAHPADGPRPCLRR